jgi:hypothetical protein
MDLEKIVKKSGVKVYDDLTYEELRGIIYNKTQEIIKVAVILTEYTRNYDVNENIMNLAVSQYNLYCKSKITDLSIDKTEFKNKAKENLEYYNNRVKLTDDSVITLQKAVECYVIDLLKLSKKECKKRNNTDKIEPKDLNNARRLIDECHF